MRYLRSGEGEPAAVWPLWVFGAGAVAIAGGILGYAIWSGLRGRFVVGYPPPDYLISQRERSRHLYMVLEGEWAWIGLAPCLPLAVIVLAGFYQFCLEALERDPAPAKRLLSWATRAAMVGIVLLIAADLLVGTAVR